MPEIKLTAAQHRRLRAACLARALQGDAEAAELLRQLDESPPKATPRRNKSKKRQQGSGREGGGEGGEGGGGGGGGGGDWGELFRWFGDLADIWEKL